jgi:hypothetical protein
LIAWVREEFIRAGAAAGATMLPKDIATIVAELLPAHNPQGLMNALRILT